MTPAAGDTQACLTPAGPGHRRPEPVVWPFRDLALDHERYDRQLLMSHLCAYRLAATLGRGRRMLEIGCGSGYGAYYLAHMAARVTAVDSDASVIARAQERFRRSNLEYRAGDGRSLGLPDGSFDVVGTFQVIEHIPEPQLVAFVRELARMIAPDGAVIISTLNLERNRKPGHPYEKPGFHEKEFTAPELRSLLERVFPVVELRGLHPTLRHHAMLRFKKWGLDRLGPRAANPVRRFYDRELSTDDHRLLPSCSPHAIDLIALCALRPQRFPASWDSEAPG
jgi:SAM-dependent methyltransferase